MIDLYSDFVSVSPSAVVFSEAFYDRGSAFPLFLFLKDGVP